MKVANIKVKERGKYLRLSIKCPDCEYPNPVKIEHQGQKRGTGAELKCIGCGATITYDWEDR